MGLFLSSSFFSNLNDLLRRFFANASWTRQIRRLIISFDRRTHPSNIFSLLFSRWVFLSLHLLIKLQLLLFLATHILSWNCLNCCLQGESVFVDLSDQNVNLLSKNSDACEDNREKKSSRVDLRQSVKKKIISSCLFFFDVRGFSDEICLSI